MQKYNFESAGGKHENKLIIGGMGKSIKTRIFKEKDFNKDLVPPQAKVERKHIHGQTFFIMQLMNI